MSKIDQNSFELTRRYQLEDRQGHLFSLSYLLTKKSDCEMFFVLGYNYSE